jgi:hypothetical protein
LLTTIAACELFIGVRAVRVGDSTGLGRSVSTRHIVASSAQSAPSQQDRPDPRSRMTWSLRRRMVRTTLCRLDTSQPSRLEKHHPSNDRRRSAAPAITLRTEISTRQLNIRTDPSSMCRLDTRFLVECTEPAREGCSICRTYSARCRIAGRACDDSIRGTQDMVQCQFTHSTGQAR